jgi:hypothetical protein
MSKPNLPETISKSEVDSEGAIIAEHPSPESLDAIKKACVYQPTGQNDITLDYDPKWYNTSACYVDSDGKTNRKPWKYIVVSPFLIPKRLRSHADFVNIFITGMAAHEGGHIIFSKPLWAHYQNWCKLVDSPICMMVANVIEDARIDDWIINGVGGSIGLAFETQAKWMGRAWLYGFEKNLHAMRKSFKNKLLGTPPGAFMVSAITMVGLYGQYGDNERMFLRLAEEYFPRMPDKYWVDFAKGVKIIRGATQHHSWKGSLEKDCHDLFVLLAKYSLKDSNGGSGSCSKESQSQASNSCQSSKSGEGSGGSPNLEGPFNTIEEAEKALKKSKIEKRLEA